MRIAVLGTGTVGRTLATKLDQLGHEVTVGTRDVSAALARNEPDPMGNPPFSRWIAEHGRIEVATFADAAASSRLVINATSGAASLDALEQVGADNLNGKVLIDVANPLDFSQGFPPTLSVVDTDSLAEQIQRTYPEARVVKTLNTMTAPVMVEPALVNDGDHTVFVSGNDAEAKADVAGLLRSFGWTDILDLGDLSTARGAEMILPIWLRVMNTLGTAQFQFKIAR